MDKKTLIEIKGLKNFLGGRWVHLGLDITIRRGEIVAIIGGSGSGKTTILRSLLMLQTPTSGELYMFQKNVLEQGEEGAEHIRKRIGMLFQHGALFSGLTVLENLKYPLEQHSTVLPKKFIEELAMMKLLFVGLDANDAHKYPAELSGGMQKRVAAARALVLDPELLLLDEPLSGLDPQSGFEFDRLLLQLREQLQLTIVMVSHDLASLKRVTDKIIFIGEGNIIVEGDYKSVSGFKHPLVEKYFSSVS